jgi:hypothetical protein
MATNQVNPVNVQVQTLSRKDIESQDEKQKKHRPTTAFDTPGDSVDVQPSRNATVSEHAEVKAPTGNKGHHALKTARHGLEKALKKAGADVKPDDNLVEKARATLDDLDAKITTALEKGSRDLPELERRRDRLIEALGVFDAVQAETAAETLGTQSVQGTEESAGTGETATEPQPEEVAALWNDLDAEFKTLGLEVTGKHDVELVKNQATALFSKNLETLKAKEAELKERFEGLKEQLKTAASPADKKRIEAEIKALEAEFKALQVQKTNLQVAYLKVNETIAHFQAAKDLGLEYEVKTKKIETKKAETKPTPRSARTASAPSAGAGAGGGVTLNTASATGSSYTQGTQGAGGGVTLGTASAESASAEGGPVEDGGAPVTGSTNVLHTSALNDFSGTTLAIASTSNALRSDARRTDEAIKKLLRAAASGNYEAIKTALILLDKRASQIVIGMGSATIKAMQHYEKQMGALSKSLDSLKATDASYNAKLAQVNSQMNIYSMNRQAIANFLQTCMTSREEIGNTTKGFIGKDAQIGSALSRW